MKASVISSQAESHFTFWYILIRDVFVCHITAGRRHFILKELFGQSFLDPLTSLTALSGKFGNFAQIEWLYQFTCLGCVLARRGISVASKRWNNNFRKGILCIVRPIVTRWSKTRDHCEWLIANVTFVTGSKSSSQPLAPHCSVSLALSTGGRALKYLKKYINI